MKAVLNKSQHYPDSFITSLSVNPQRNTFVFTTLTSVEIRSLDNLNLSLFFEDFRVAIHDAKLFKESNLLAIVGEESSTGESLFHPNKVVIYDISSRSAVSEIAFSSRVEHIFFHDIDMDKNELLVFSGDQVHRFPFPIDPRSEPKPPLHFQNAPRLAIGKEGMFSYPLGSGDYQASVHARVKLQGSTEVDNESPIKALTFAADNTLLVGAVKYKNSIRIKLWESNRNGYTPKIFDVPFEISDQIFSIAIDPTKKFILLGTSSCIYLLVLSESSLMFGYYQKLSCEVFPTGPSEPQIAIFSKSPAEDPCIRFQGFSLEGSHRTFEFDKNTKKMLQTTHISFHSQFLA